MAKTLNNSQAAQMTEEEAEKLQRKIAREYRKAYKDLSATAKDYFLQFDIREQAYKKGLEDGTILPPAGKTPEQHFAEWRIAQIGRGKRWETLRDQMANRIVEANSVCASYINDTTPTIASLNYNYSAYQIESALNMGDHAQGAASFTLTNEQTIKNLMLGNNQSEFKVSDGKGGFTFRKNAVNKQTDYNWNTKKIQSALMQGILCGESATKVSKRFLQVMGSNEKAAMRNARTSVTSAQNAGTLQAYKDAEAMGIDMLVEWMATIDDRTRDSHGELDGIRIKVGAKFPNGLRYPADPHGAPAEVYNCRCTTVGVIAGIEDDPTVSKIAGHEGIHTAETYNQWLNRKQAEQQQKQAQAIAKKQSSVYDNTSKQALSLQKRAESMRDITAPDKMIELGKAFYELPEMKDAVEEVRRISEAKSAQLQALQEFYDTAAKYGYKSKEAAEKREKYNNLYMEYSRLQRSANAGEKTANAISIIRREGLGFSDKAAVSSHMPGRSTVKKYVEHAYSMYPASWCESSSKRGMLTVKKVTRGYYSDFNRIIAIDADEETALHELGHRFEYARPKIRATEKEFYEYRTAGEPLEWLGGGYKRTEVTRKDSFDHPYMGKDYHGTAYELVSMGFEYTLSRTGWNGTDDEMKYWIAGILISK